MCGSCAPPHMARTEQQRHAQGPNHLFPCYINRKISIHISWTPTDACMGSQSGACALPFVTSANRSGSTLPSWPVGPLASSSAAGICTSRPSSLGFLASSTSPRWSGTRYTGPSTFSPSRSSRSTSAAHSWSLECGFMRELGGICLLETLGLALFVACLKKVSRGPPYVDTICIFTTPVLFGG